MEPDTLKDIAMHICANERHKVGWLVLAPAGHSDGDQEGPTGASHKYAMPCWFNAHSQWCEGQPILYNSSQSKSYASHPSLSLTRGGFYTASAVRESCMHPAVYARSQIFWGFFCLHHFQYYDTLNLDGKMITIETQRSVKVLQLRVLKVIYLHGYLSCPLNLDGHTDRQTACWPSLLSHV